MKERVEEREDRVEEREAMKKEKPSWLGQRGQYSWEREASRVEKERPGSGKRGQCCRKRGHGWGREAMAVVQLASDMSQCSYPRLKSSSV